MKITSIMMITSTMRTTLEIKTNKVKIPLFLCCFVVVVVVVVVLFLLIFVVDIIVDILVVVVIVNIAYLLLIIPLDLVVFSKCSSETP